MKIKLPSDIPTHARCAVCQQLVPVESMLQDRAGYICDGCFDATYHSEPTGVSSPWSAMTALVLAICGLASLWLGVHSSGLFVILSVGLLTLSAFQAVEMKRLSKPPLGRMASLAANAALCLSVSMMASMLLYMSVSFVRFLQHSC